MKYNLSQELKLLWRLEVLCYYFSNIILASFINLIILLFTLILSLLFCPNFSPIDSTKEYREWSIPSIHWFLILSKVLLLYLGNRVYVLVSQIFIVIRIHRVWKPCALKYSLLMLLWILSLSRKKKLIKRKRQKNWENIVRKTYIFQLKQTINNSISIQSNMY